MKEKNSEKFVKRVAMTIVIIAIAATIFSSCHTENKRISKNNIPEIIDLSKEDAIVESCTNIGEAGYVSFVIIRGHEYAIFSSRLDEMESSALWGIHLTETCIGCRYNNVEIDTITINHHKFMITKIKYKNGRYGIGAKHLEPAPIGGCDYCWNQKEK